MSKDEGQVILERLDHVIERLTQVVTKEEFNSLVKIVESHERFINGNGQPGARVDIAQIRCTTETMSEQLSELVRQSAEEKPAKPEDPDKNGPTWKWIVVGVVTPLFLAFVSWFGGLIADMYTRLNTIAP